MNEQANKPSEESLIIYPTDFPLKIMGNNQEGFLEEIIALVKEHDPVFDPLTVEKNHSRSNTYVSLRITVTATSREQLDNLYRALTSHEMVKVVF